MAKAKTPSYVLTLRLATEIYHEHKLSKSFEISRNIYNACLAELYKRYGALKQSKRYRMSCKMTKGKERNRMFSELNKEFGLVEYLLHEFVKPVQHKFKQNIEYAQTYRQKHRLTFETLYGDDLEMFLL